MTTDRAGNETDEAAFTMVELVVVLALTAVVFLALASTLATDLKAVAIQKARSAANEIATQGIEDLQRYDFNDLGACPTQDPTPALPSTLTSFSVATLPNCSSTTILQDPCHATSGTLTTFAVPRQSYTCSHNNVQYSVRRFILWSNTQQTGKRLAVFVDWVDAVGRHEISQQSSLRSPNVASVVGVPPPQFVSVSASGSTSPVSIDNNGTLLSTLTFTANVNGLTASDSVYVTLNTLTTQPDGTVAALPTQFALSSGDGINWSATLPGATAPIFGAGSQYVVFTGVRTTSDGKANSKIAQGTLTFCPTGGCPSGLPTLSNATATTPVDIDTSGVLQSAFTIAVTANNLSSSSTVVAVIPTQTGAASFPLAYQTSCSNGNNCTTWSGSFTSTSDGSARFLPGSQPFYITAINPPTGTGGSFGSSAVTTTNTVTFG